MGATGLSVGSFQGKGRRETYGCPTPCSAPSPAFLPFCAVLWPPWPKVQVSCSLMELLGQHSGFLAPSQEPSFPGTGPPRSRSCGPCPFLPPASSSLCCSSRPLTCRAWLGAAPSKRESRAGQERDPRSGVRHSCSTLLPWAGPYASDSPSVIHPAQCLGLGRSSISLAFLTLWLPLGLRGKSGRSRAVDCRRTTVAPLGLPGGC